MKAYPTPKNKSPEPAKPKKKKQISQARTTKDKPARSPPLVAINTIKTHLATRKTKASIKINKLSIVHNNIFSSDDDFTPFSQLKAKIKTGN